MVVARNQVMEFVRKAGIARPEELAALGISRASLSGMVTAVFCAETAAGFTPWRSRA